MKWKFRKTLIGLRKWSNKYRYGLWRNRNVLSALKEMKMIRCAISLLYSVLWIRRSNAHWCFARDIGIKNTSPVIRLNSAIYSCLSPVERQVNLIRMMRVLKSHLTELRPLGITHGGMVQFCLWNLSTLLKLLKTWIILYINLEVQAIMVIGRSSTYMFPQRRKKIMKR